MTYPAVGRGPKEKPLPGQLRTKWLNSMIIDACPVDPGGRRSLLLPLIYDLW